MVDNDCNPIGFVCVNQISDTHLAQQNPHLNAHDGTLTHKYASYNSHRVTWTTEERARKFIPNPPSQKRKQALTHTPHKHEQSSVAWLGAWQGWFGLVLFLPSCCWLVLCVHMLSTGGGQGGYGPMLHMDGIRPEPCRLFFKSRGYLVTKKGTLIKYYTVSGFISLRFTFITQCLPHKRIPLYSRMMALLVFLPHSGHMWFASGVKPT